MDSRATLRMNVWLLLAILMIYLIAELTNQTLFSWIPLIISVWVFLNLYWLSICCIAYWSEQHTNSAIEESTSPVETEFTTPPEPVPSSDLARRMHQTATK